MTGELVHSTRTKNQEMLLTFMPNYVYSLDVFQFISRQELYM